MTELYGEFNLATMEWKDGLIGSIFRAQVADSSTDEKWTVCDGPVDALWIENMNTVLDDNKLLTLINGERIKMNSTMHMLFEVADLVLDNCAPVGDALAEIPGMEQRVAPSSTVSGAALLNTVVALAVGMIFEENGDPPVFMSANLDGGDEYNQRWLEHYRGRLTYL